VFSGEVRQHSPAEWVFALPLRAQLVRAQRIGFREPLEFGLRLRDLDFKPFPEEVKVSHDFGVASRVVIRHARENRP
jgi:hypothetical protein